MLNKPIVRVSVTFGLLTGVIVFAYCMVLYALGLPALGGKKEVSVGFNLIMMGVAVWYFRRTYGQGYLHLWQALSVCYLTNLIGAATSASLLWLLVSYIDPQVLSSYIVESLKIAEFSKKDVIEQMGTAAYQAIVTGLKATTPSTIFADELVKKLLLGAIPALLISLFFRKQPPILV
jgi:hypothetical protein